MRKLTITTDGETVAHELTDDLITIGRAPENLIRLDDPSVSSRHAQLQHVGETYELKDFDSTNGTRVNGRAITTTALYAGDKIQFGKIEACFECPQPEHAQPLPARTDVEARPAEVSARPADFANASPFPKRSSERDRSRLAIFAAAALALLAFLASMLALMQIRPPTP